MSADRTADMFSAAAQVAGRIIADRRFTAESFRDFDGTLPFAFPEGFAVEPGETLQISADELHVFDTDGKLRATLTAS